MLRGAVHRSALVATHEKTSGMFPAILFTSFTYLLLAVASVNRAEAHVFKPLLPWSSGVQQTHLHVRSASPKPQFGLNTLFVATVTSLTTLTSTVTCSISATEKCPGYVKRKREILSDLLEDKQHDEILHPSPVIRSVHIGATLLPPTSLMRILLLLIGV